MKWHYEECCIEMLFVLTVIAGVFNVIAAIYFQVAYQQGGSLSLCVYMCVCGAVLFWDIIKMHFRLINCCKVRLVWVASAS